jgi:caspase domain-containing protein
MNRLFGVVIGCNYEGTPRTDLPPLQGAERDAKRMAGLLVTQPIEDGTLGGMALLLGAAVTTSQITESIGRMQALQTPDDTLLVYFAGHGRRDAGGLRICAWDADLPARQLLTLLEHAGLPAGLVLDCCHAGAIGDAQD